MSIVTTIKITTSILVLSAFIYFYLKSGNAKKKMLKMKKIMQKWHKKWLLKNEIFNMQQQKLREDYETIQNEKIIAEQKLQQAKLIESRAEKTNKDAQQKIAALENQVAKLAMQLKHARQNVKRRKQQLNELKE
jgi:hypothetical protein